MSYIIALAGKGGTGKTTIAALLVRLLTEEKRGSVLAVDADPNSNLGEVLGLPQDKTVGTILDEVAARPDMIPGGMSKDRYIEYQVQTSVQEGDGFDILTMGKPEGPGCYCYVNNVLRNVVEQLIEDYSFVIIDNEAGLEHLSRRTTRRADCLLIVSQPKPVALRAARRISELSDELKISIGKKMLLVNSCQPVVHNGLTVDTGMRAAGCIPEDPGISDLSLAGRPIGELPASSAAYAALKGLLKKIV